MKNIIHFSLLTGMALFIRFSLWLVNFLSINKRLAVVRWLGRAYGSLPHRQKNELITNLQNFTNTHAASVKKKTTTIFENFALTLYDFFNPVGVTLESNDRDRLNKLRQTHNGFLALTFHIGNWELGARVMREWGWPVTAVYQPYQNTQFKNLIEKNRAPGVHFIPVGRHAADGVRAALRRGDIVAMLGDHPFGEEGIPVKLKNHDVLWPKGPILLAIREKAPIVVSVIVRTSDRHYTAIIEDIIYTHHVSRSNVRDIVQLVADKFAKLIDRYSDQWYRFQEFTIVSEAKTPPTKQSSELNTDLKETVLS